MSILSNAGTMAAMLRRQPRTRTRKSPQLHIIEEESESEPRSSTSSAHSPSSSRVGSPVSGVKARRRNARISASDIKIASTILSDLDGGAAPLTPTRPAPSPPPNRDSDEFSIIFTEKEFDFPHPPLPTPSAYVYGSDMSSPSSSSGSSAVPGTPTTSDDEFATTQPLHIAKKPRAGSPDSSSDSDSDLEEDYAWYSRELAGVVDMQPQLARRPTITGTRPRPESIYVAATSSTRVLPCHMPSPQLDPACPRRTFVIPKRPPPPPPVERTPPRESRVPEDLVDDLLEEYFQSPTSSPSQSDFSEESLLEDIPFFLDNEEEEENEDAPIQLPLCLPTSPFAVDFEFDEGHMPFTLEERRPSIHEPAIQEELEEEEDCNADSESRILRSRWSSSTLDSAYSAGATSPKARLMKIWNRHTSSSSKSPSKSSTPPSKVLSSPPKSPKPKTTKHAHSRSVSSYLASPRSPYFKFRPEEVAVVDYANALPLPSATSSHFPPSASSSVFPHLPSRFPLPSEPPLPSPRHQRHHRAQSASTPPALVASGFRSRSPSSPVFGQYLSSSGSRSPSGFRSPHSSTPPAVVCRSPSRQSCDSADSGDTSASSGLRRKPIPVEMFLRA
ncbi:uncharacterized protein SCHCODRAFT_01331193 [Schizophyllum commune H4-8]|uniref:uncharacterized protein n=1 Tax=Schizophyllum commune (strain H4-8 / FGSC 9210) TaxID=578458 RepID=UPI00215F92DD|nr:uncharacterized protein SCHCODRAFT_01331193 [Schizophyllum commune H4-8]KAI5888380.1 hypothetical protein SCHCODRAFT_01331193 [Schizophyllum commune H4-8]